MKKQFLSALFLVAALAGNAGNAVARTVPSGPPSFCGPQPCAGQISQRGNVMMRDGSPWIVKGVNISGRVVPEGQLNAPFIGKRLRAAHAAFGPATFDKVKQFGADTISLKVSQPGLDPGHRFYDPAYRASVVDAIAMARRSGLAVIISMQWQPGSGSNTEEGRFGPSNTAAWRALLDVLPRDDAGLMFDLLNEPEDMATRANWKAWSKGNEALIRMIRDLGFRSQFVLVSGLQSSHTLRDAPSVRDPAGRIAYAVHPYFNARQMDFTDPRSWDVQFGDFCDRHICMISEWGLALVPDGPNVGCAGDAPALTRALLEYGWRRRMGMVGWSLDYPDTLMVGPAMDRPTSFDGWQGRCTREGGIIGAGQMISDWFHAHP